MAAVIATTSLRFAPIFTNSSENTLVQLWPALLSGCPASGPAAPMPPSESPGRGRCGCCSVLSVSLCLSRRWPPYRARPGRSGHDGASYDSCMRLANALPRLPWPPRAWARRPGARQTAAWAKETQYRIRPCPQWPGSGPDLTVVRYASSAGRGQGAEW